MIPYCSWETQLLASFPTSLPTTASVCSTTPAFFPASPFPSLSMVQGLSRKPPLRLWSPHPLEQHLGCNHSFFFFLQERTVLLKQEKGCSSQLGGGTRSWDAPRMQPLLIQVCITLSSCLARFCTPQFNGAQSVACETLGVLETVPGGS